MLLKAFAGQTMHLAVFKQLVVIQDLARSLFRHLSRTSSWHLLRMILIFVNCAWWQHYVLLLWGWVAHVCIHVGLTWLVIFATLDDCNSIGPWPALSVGSASSALNFSTCKVIIVRVRLHVVKRVVHFHCSAMSRIICQLVVHAVGNELCRTLKDLSLSSAQVCLLLIHCSFPCLRHKLTCLCSRNWLFLPSHLMLVCLKSVCLVSIWKRSLQELILARSLVIAIPRVVWILLLAWTLSIENVEVPFIGASSHSEFLHVIKGRLSVHRWAAFLESRGILPRHRVWLVFIEWMSIIIVLHHWTHWLKIVIKPIVKRCLLAILRWTSCLVALVKVVPSLLELRPIIACLF